MPEQKYLRFTFLLLSVSAVVGLGNYWGFIEHSYNFGGAFLIAYIIAVFVLGLPLLILEFAPSRKYKLDITALFSKIKSLKNFGWFIMVTGFIIAVYYSLLLSWNIIYLFTSFGMPWKNNPLYYFTNNVLQLSPEISQIGDIALPVFISLIISWLLMFFIVRKGAVTIKKTASILLPISILLIIFFLIRILPLNGSLKGLSYFLEINFSAMYSLSIWKTAFLQAFLSLGLALGFFTFYSSNNKEGFVLGDSLIVITSKIIFTILVIFVIFSSLGVLSQKTPLEKIRFNSLNSPLSSQFILFPEMLALTKAPTFTSLMLFFIFLIITILGSASVVYFLCSTIAKKFGIDYKKSAIIICGMGFLVGIPFTTSSGFYFLDLLQHFIYNYNLLIIGIMECILIGWKYKTEQIIKYLNENSKIKIGYIWNILIKFFIPIILFLLILSLLKADLMLLYNNYPLWAIIGAWALILLPLAIVFVLPRKK